MNREPSLDILRGLAIFGMVLSGSIAFGGVLPAWMYHAQVPPPLHQFDPSLPGITWVDLVFPFFLFSMGAAFPLALQGAIKQQKSFLYFFKLSAKRFFLLAFFALFTQHLKAWVITADPGATDYILSLLAFALLFGILNSRWSGLAARFKNWIRVVCFIIAIALLAVLPFRGGAGFDLYKSDIILMVLANMAFVGSLVYYFTAHRLLIRLLILAVVGAVIITAREPLDSPVKSFFYFQEMAGFKFDWLYKFYFLKYLFIVIPGTIVGEWMQSASWKEQPAAPPKVQRIYAITVVVLLIGFLYLLLNRQQAVALAGRSIWILFLVGSASICWLYRTCQRQAIKDTMLLGWGLLLMGLVLEPYEGGIKKDPSTFSYYFICSGFAALLLPLFRFLSALPAGRFILTPLGDIGKNPMLAYVTGSLLLLPVLSLTGLKPFWDSLVHSAWQGLLKGLLFTAAVVVVTRFSVQKKWFWKT